MAKVTNEILSGQASEHSFTLRSNELGGQLAQQHYSNGMGFAGQNQSPQLFWENPPQHTKAFAVTMYDVDAPTGSGLWHWVVFNIPSGVHELKAGAGDPTQNLLPQGAVQSNSDIGIPGYVGAAPPEGPAHRYLITVYALSQKLELDQQATPALAGFGMHYVTLAKASLLVYGQKQ